MNLLTDDRLELLRRRLAAAGLADGAAAPVRAEIPTDAGEFGIAERRMWKIYDFDRDSVSHNIALILGFDGSYTVEKVAAAFERMVAGAAVLASVVVVDAEGVPHREPVDLTGRWVEPDRVREWGAIPAHTGTDVAEIARVFATAPFRLTEEPPVRARLSANADGGVTLILVVHHLAVDDTSWPPLLGTLVSGSWPAAAAPADRPIADVERALRHARATWAAEDVRFPLSGALPEIDAAASWLAPMDETPGARLELPLDPAAVAGAEILAREIGATPNALYIALTALGVHALTGATDHVLLVPVDNRRPGADPARVGYSGNIVPMRFALDPSASVRETLRAAVGAGLAAMEFSSIDYGTLLTALRGAGGRFPVAEILASVRNAPLRGIPIPDGARVTCESVFHGIGNYPLTFAFELGAEDTVHLEVDHQIGVVTAERAERAARLLIALVERTPAALDDEVRALVAAVGEPEGA